MWVFHLLVYYLAFDVLDLATVSLSVRNRHLLQACVLFDADFRHYELLGLLHPCYLSFFESYLASAQQDSRDQDFSTWFFVLDHGIKQSLT